MFFFFGLIVLVLGAIPLFITLARAKKYDRQTLQLKVRNAAVVLFLTIGFLIGVNVFFHYYSEFLWFYNLGYAERFWTIVGAEAALYTAGAVIAFLFLAAVLRISLHRLAIRTGFITVSLIAAIIALFVAAGAGAMWEETLLFLFRTRSTVTDPIFGLNSSFYLFSLPFVSRVVPWISTLLFVGLVAIAGSVFISLVVSGGNAQDAETVLNRVTPVAPLVLILASLLLMAFAVHTWLDAYRLLYSETGPVTGAGYVDVHIRRWALWGAALLYGVVSLALIAAAVSRRFRQGVLGIRWEPPDRKIARRTIIIPAAALAIVALITWVAPGLVQTLYVSPNEITLERPFIKNHIEFTQHGYGIDTGRVDERQYRIGRTISPDVVNENQPTLMNVRLWDWRALMDNLREQQEIRLYYEFNDVDIGRYYIDGEYRQVMLSVREMEKQALAPQSQNWVSRHLKYTHGYGMVLLPVHEFLPQGKPNLLIRNIPPQEKVQSLQIKQPRIYYGERTDDNVYVNTTEPEFDYPAGEQNVTTKYQGTGGVPVGSLWRRFLCAWKFDDYRLLLSTYFTRESRVLFDRLITERALKVAPFLELDEDPYAVLTDEGRIVYIIDAYTTSAGYPYAEPYRGFVRTFTGLNYMRNSVKIVVDAYDGTTNFYVADSSDVLIQAYQKIFPGVFQPLDSLSDYLHRHIRYPADFMAVQADMYGVYHMDDPEVFYQREDVWQFATERYREDFQRVTPYYVMIKFPEQEDIELVLMVPFTPKNKNVMNAWMAARCDFPHYGRIMVFPFPKGVEVLGPRQMEARIDQDTEMSQRMTLWGQRGSEVIRGNLLAIPLFAGESLYILYSEPIFVQAEDAQLPEIKRIALADQRRVVWADSFEKALRRLIGERVEQVAEAPEAPGRQGPPEMQSLVRQAVELFEQYQQQASEGNFSQAGERLEELREILGQLRR